MRLILISAILFTALNSCSQKSKDYHFPEIGMNMQVPNYFVVRDSFARPSYLDSNYNPVRDSAEIRRMENDLIKTLLLVKYPDERNSMVINIALKTSKTGDLTQYYDLSKTMQRIMAQQQMETYDSSFKIYHTSNISIQKFLTNSIQKSPKLFSGFYLAKVKNYYLFVKVDYTDETIGDEFEKMLLSSTFK